MQVRECLNPTESMLEGFERVDLGRVPDFDSAQKKAWDLASRKRKDPDLLAWWDADARLFSPNTSCLGEEQPAWMKYARANGSDLAISSADRRFVFLFREGRI